MYEKIEQLCPDCFQIITNPICEKCYTRQLEIWLNDYVRSPKTVNYIIKRMNQGSISENPEGSNCILCKNEIISICTYCYFAKVNKILKELNVSDELIEYFLEIFNYKIYSKRHLSKRMNHSHT